MYSTYTGIALDEDQPLVEDTAQVALFSPCTLPGYGPEFSPSDPDICRHWASPVSESTSSEAIISFPVVIELRLFCQLCPHLQDHCFLPLCQIELCHLSPHPLAGFRRVVARLGSELHISFMLKLSGEREM